MEIMITNIMTPRMRSMSDPILDNSLAILDGDLKAHGIEAKIIDGCNIDLYKQFTFFPLSRAFRSSFQKNIAKMEQGAKPSQLSLVFGLTWDTLLEKYQNQQMERWLRKVAREVATEHVPFFGIKTWYGNAYQWAKRLVELVNEYSPETITICGGPQANIYHFEGAVLKYSNFDLAVYSSGREILAEILQVARSGKTKAERLRLIKEATIDNVIYREGDQIVVNPLREANLEQNIIPTYRETKGKVWIHNLVDGLGCPWNKCNFCPHKNITPRYLMRPIQDVLAEIKAVLKEGVGVFRFCGSDTPLKVGVKLAEAILAEELNLVFSMFNRAVKGAKSQYAEIRDSYRILIRAGLRAVFVGIETAHDIINDKIMNKNLCQEDVLYTLRAVREAGELEGTKCEIIMAFIYPTPLVDGITSDEVMEENLKLIQDVQPSSVLITPAGVFPETNWYDRPEEFGFELGENYLHDLMHCEYILNKPPQLWKHVPQLMMNGEDTAAMFKESGRLGRAVKQLGIPTGIGDEVMLMYSLTGYSDKEKLITANGEFFFDVTACDYRHVEQFYAEFNEVSRAIAMSNFRKDRSHG